MGSYVVFVIPSFREDKSWTYGKEERYISNVWNVKKKRSAGQNDSLDGRTWNSVRRSRSCPNRQHNQIVRAEIFGEESK
jgi:hypothetical protein